MNDCPALLELRVGPIAAVELALYAAASGDLNPLHLDADVARAAGFDRPIAHGMRTMACVGRLFTETFGATALRALTTKFTGSAQLGDTLLLRATLSEVDSERALAHYDIDVRTAADAPVVTGRALVAIARGASPVVDAR